jgi:general secretion pathway protein G
MTRREFLRKATGGFTFIELLVTVGVLMVLASAALPLARVTMKRQRESELRDALRKMRSAIDRFKDMADTQIISPMEVPFGSEGYPKSLSVLVDGVNRNNDASGTKIKLLRRIPIDPMTGEAEWGMRSYQDRPDSTAWGGQNVYDVYSKSTGIALDGTKYKDW